MNPKEMARVIPHIACELFRCYSVRLSSQTVPPSLYSPSPAMNLRGRLFPGIVRAEGAGRRRMGATGTASTRTWGGS
jgi:hypothetical protein